VLRPQGNRALVKTFALAAKAIAACAGSHVLTLDVVARIAVGVVVIDTLSSEYHANFFAMQCDSFSAPSIKHWGCISNLAKGFPR
jgi:hypothetical protein